MIECKDCEEYSILVSNMEEDEDRLRAQRDRLQNQIFGAFSYFKESTAEQVCTGPEPKLVYELVEQLWNAYQSCAAKNDLLQNVVANERERYRKALEFILNNSTGFHLAYDAANRALHPEEYCPNCEARFTPDDTYAKCECCGNTSESK